MSTIFRILGGFALSAIGFVIVWKSEWFLQNFGAIPWAEAKLGTSGGSRLFYKLIGLGVIFVGILMMTGLFGGLLLGTVGRLFVPPT